MARTFLDEDFLLSNETARRLYHEVAATQPIIDYHCHLPPAEIAANRQFENLHAVWLEGDHYKWRAMRANGVQERFCTGDASPYEKFVAFAETVPMTLRNPLYHWSHLELRRYFGIETLLGPGTASAIWEEANARLQEPSLRVHGILAKWKVEVVGTTDDPTDALEAHREIRESGLPTRVVPTFRPDKATFIDRVEEWNAWCDALAAVSGERTEDLDGFLRALRQRHDFFAAAGCRLSDHGLAVCPEVGAQSEEAATTFRRARAGERVSPTEADRFAGYLMVEFGRWNAGKGWTQQLHLGALRNNSSRQFASLGRDTGFDSIGDWPQTARLSRYLDALDHDGCLPKVVLYNLNPTDNYAFATMAGNFCDGSVAGKVQFGSGWWFNDQKEGMTAQLNALSNLGLLSRFVGMLTDSRSFLSFPRHEYFRRILCDLLGRDVENGEIPDDRDLLDDYVRRICYTNARDFFGVAPGAPQLP